MNQCNLIILWHLLLVLLEGSPRCIVRTCSTVNRQCCHNGKNHHLQVLAHTYDPLQRSHLQVIVFLLCLIIKSAKGKIVTKSSNFASSYVATNVDDIYVTIYSYIDDAHIAINSNIAGVFDTISSNVTTPITLRSSLTNTCVNCNGNTNVLYYSVKFNSIITVNCNG